MNASTDILDSFNYELNSQAMAIVFYSDLNESRKLDFIKNFLANLNNAQKDKFISMVEKNINPIKYINQFLKNNYTELTKFLCSHNILSNERILEQILEDSSFLSVINVIKPVFEGKVSPSILREYCKNATQHKYSGLDNKKQKELESFIVNNCDLNLLDKTKEHIQEHIFDFQYCQDKEIELFKNLLEKVILNQKPNSLSSQVVYKFKRAFTNWTTKKEDENKEDLYKKVGSIFYELLKKSSVIEYANKFTLEEVVNEKNYTINNFIDFYNKIDEKTKVEVVFHIINFNSDGIKNKKIDECLNFLNEKIDTDNAFKNYSYTFRFLNLLSIQAGESNINPIKSKIINKLKSFVVLTLDDVLKDFIFDHQYNNKNDARAQELLSECLSNFLDNNVIVPLYLKEILINKKPESTQLIEVFFDKQELTNAISAIPVSDNSRNQLKI